MPALPLPAFLAAMDASRRSLTLALGISLLFHALLLAVHFTPPDLMDKAREQALDVILVNSKHAQRPNQAQARAQANLDGGGNTEDARRAKTPLPPSAQTQEGNSLLTAQQRVTQLEAEARQMLTQIKSEAATRREKTQNPPTPPTPTPSGADLASHALAIARLEGEIAQQMEAYNQRPRKKFIGARVSEYRFAQYVEDWRQKIERVGNMNYPTAARGRLYGSLVLTVVIKADGELDRVEINRSSGQKVLDEAAQRIVRLAAPYAPFPDNIRRDTDVLEITRTWTFTSADQLQAN
ncbi:MAG: energy transducer TonB [Betaproteobacteria bacterium HGW-Betaproteobacteria-11]|nr:MAG: energy transducer TonB [Betaproteobacteria bacterium HGW-Betaproteobacteria-11]